MGVTTRAKAKESGETPMILPLPARRRKKAPPASPSTLSVAPAPAPVLTPEKVSTSIADAQSTRIKSPGVEFQGSKLSSQQAPSTPHSTPSPPRAPRPSMHTLSRRARVKAHSSRMSTSPSPILNQMQRVGAHMEKKVGAHSISVTTLSYAKALSSSPARSPRTARAEETEEPIDDIVLRPLNPTARILSDEELFHQRKERKQARWEYHEKLRKERIAKNSAAKAIVAQSATEPPVPSTPPLIPPRLPPPLPSPTPAIKSTVTIPAKLFSKDLLSNIFCRRAKKHPESDTTAILTAISQVETPNTSKVNGMEPHTPMTGKDDSCEIEENQLVREDPAIHAASSETDLIETPHRNAHLINSSSPTRTQEIFHDFTSPPPTIPFDDRSLVKELITNVSPSYDFPLSSETILKHAKSAKTGEEVVVAWSFDRQNKLNISSGKVLGKKGRGGAAKIAVEYLGLYGHRTGESLTGQLPPHNNVRIYKIIWKSGKNVEEELHNTDQLNTTSTTEQDLDFEPLPTMRTIPAEYIPGEVMIFRDILRDYPDSNYEYRNRIWHRLMSATKHSLATIRETAGKKRRRKPHPHEVSQCSPAEENLEKADIRAAKKAIRLALEGCTSKATKVLDIEVRKGRLSDAETLAKLEALHPQLPCSFQLPTDAPAIACVTSVELREAGRRLAKGAAPGPSGMTDGILRILLDDETCCSCLCHMMRDLVNGNYKYTFRNLG